MLLARHGAWLALVLFASVAEARLPAHGLFSLEPQQDDEPPVTLTISPADEEPSAFSLVSPLQMNLELETFELDDSSDGGEVMPLAPIIHTVQMGVVRGAMLDRCRFRMRKIRDIGHGASPDGRPAACRLLSFAGRQKFRERGARRRPPARLRFVAPRQYDVVLAELSKPGYPVLPMLMIHAPVVLAHPALLPPPIIVPIRH